MGQGRMFSSARLSAVANLRATSAKWCIYIYVPKEKKGLVFSDAFPLLRLDFFGIALVDEKLFVIQGSLGFISAYTGE